MNLAKAMLEDPKPHRILIVEDEGLIAHDISLRLEAIGHVVVDTVSTAEAAVEMAPQADMILMDIRIDGPRDGIDAAREIRQKYRLPVIFLTSQADRSTLDRAKLTGPFAYLIKPLGTASLQSAIEIAFYTHRMERELEDQVEWLRATLDSASDAIVITARDGSIRSLNFAAERLTGWTSEQASGLPFDSVVRLVAGSTTAGEQPLEAAEPVELALLRDAAVEFDASWRLIDRSGRELAVEGSAAPLRSGNDAFGTVLTFRDATEKRRQEQQTNQARRLDTAARLAANVADEYSNLVAVIRSQADHLLAQVGEYSPVRRAIEEIRQAAAGAAQISRRMASFRTSPSTHKESFTLNSLLRRMGKLIQSAAGDRIKVSLRISPASGRVHANSDRMEQAIMNLVVHACSNMPEGGELILETSQLDLPLSPDTTNWVMLKVQYSSEEADLEHIFEPVASPDCSLALPLAHAIVREHGGYLTVQSARGGGTRVELLLPRLGEAQRPEDAPSAVAPSVLLVEDRESIRKQLHNFFESSGYNLLEAADVPEAVTLGQMYTGGLDLLIAKEESVEEIATALRLDHASLAVLRVVDHPETRPDEIRRPFSQRILLEKAGSLLASVAGPRPAV